MALRITERGGLFPNKLYKMVENEADDFIKWSKAGNWILICSDQQKFLSSAILTKYSMKNSFQNFVRQLNYYGFFAFKEEQKIAKAAGQLEIDQAYLYFRHESNCFKKGHPELLQRIKKSSRVTKRRASSMEENASNTETYPESLPKTRKTRKGNEASEGVDSRLGGTEIAKPSYPSQGQCGSRFITSCTMDSQSPASTASQMHNTDNIDSSHGEGSENGDLNNDSSLHFKVCAEYREDQGRLYGVHLPRWCTNGGDLPDVYEVIERHLTTKGSDAIDTILEASNLSEELLHHIKSISNKSVPGKWIPLEVRIALGLVALAQKGTEKDQLTLEKLAALKRVPIPSFYGDIAQQLTTTTQDSGEESGCFTEDQGNQEHFEESPVTINPKEGPTEGKVPFSLEFKNIPISESVEFLLVEFGTGNVVEACRPRSSKNTWFGHTPPSNTSETVTVDVTVRTPDHTVVGKTSYTYYSNEVDAAFIVVARYLAQDEFNGEQQANPERGENSGTSSFFGFSKQGVGSSVNILRRLVFTAARVGAEHFIRIIFGTSNGRVVYETYKTESLFPEDIAAANGHDSIAAYLISQCKRFCEESNTSQRQSKDVNWRELLKAIEDKEARSRRKEAKKKEVEGNDISENVCFADNEDSSDTSPERTEGHPDPYDSTAEKMFLGYGAGGSYDGSEETRTEFEIVCKRGLYKVGEEDVTSYGKESLSVDESCEVEVDEPSTDSPQLPTEDAHDIIQSKSDQGRKEAKKKEVDGSDISQNGYFADNENSSDSDPGRTEVDEEDATFYGKESLSVDESCEVDVDEPSFDSPQLPTEFEHDTCQSKSGQELIRIPHRLSLKVEGTDAMDVDVPSPKISEEYRFVTDVYNRKFVENVLHYTITLEKGDAEAVLRPINAVLNSGGGIVMMKIDDFSKFEAGDLNEKIETFWQTLEQKLNPMIEPSTYDDVFDKKLEGDTIHLFITATNHLCTVDYNMHLPFEAGSFSRPTYEKVVSLLWRNALENHIPEVPLTDLPIDLLPKQFTYKKVLDFHESKQVQLKYFTSKNGLFHSNNQRAQDKIAEQISSFGNGSGGMILVGIEDKTGETLGQEITADGKAEWESGFQAMINQMSETWSFTPIQGEHWDIEFSPVDGTKSSFVIVVRIAGMRNSGGIFTKCPKSFELLNPSGSDGEEEIVPIDFHEWKQRMMNVTFQGQSKGTQEVMEKFRLSSLLSGPLLTVLGSVKEIVEAFFPVGPGCHVVPKGFVSNLPEEAQVVIRKIQEQITNGLLVASPSMLSAVQKEEQRKEDGVICDLLLLSESLGRLHLISLVSGESQDQFFPHARVTAKALKESLVKNGGCYEKFYITCQVVLCNRVGTEPLEIPSPDSRYPKEYHLGSSPQELVKIKKILQSLVIVLAQFPSFLSNKQGLSFLNLLTKEQFGLLYNEIDEHKELWIHGAAGTGKTVVAFEFIRELLRRDPKLRPANILYVCERPEMLPQIRKLEICECRTREAFMEESFPQIEHVILDEVQNFQAKDGDWLKKARKLVRQRESTLGQGYLWCFMDKAQGIYKAKSGIPQRPPQTFILTKVIRNSKRIFNHAEQFLDRRIWRLPQSPIAQGKLLTIGHDFDGEQSEVEYSTGEHITRLIEVLESLLKEGYSKGDIAVLCFSEPLEGNELKQLQKFTSTVSAQRNNEDSIVLSTVADYGGLERPVVIMVRESFAPNSTDVRLNRLRYCARTRGMVKLVTLTKESKGQKKKRKATKY